jgi:hypothetical protein
MRDALPFQVLGTDMAKHFEDVSKLSAKIGALNSASGNGNSEGLVSPKAKKVMMGSIVCVGGVGTGSV